MTPGGLQECVGTGVLLTLVIQILFVLMLGLIALALRGLGFDLRAVMSTALNAGGSGGKLAPGGGAPDFIDTLDGDQGVSVGPNGTPW